jgi:hypothetical protein
VKASAPIQTVAAAAPAPTPAKAPLLSTPALATATAPAAAAVKGPASSTNRSGLGDGSNPGQGAGSVNSPNQGTNNPSKTSAPVTLGVPVQKPMATAPAKAATAPVSPLASSGTLKPASTPTVGAVSSSRSGLLDGTNPGNGAGKINAPQQGTDNPSKNRYGRNAWVGNETEGELKRPLHAEAHMLTCGSIASSADPTTGPLHSGMTWICERASANEKAPLRGPVHWMPGGEGGIRTRGGLLTLTRFPGVRLKPLIHLSCEAAIVAAPSPHAALARRASSGLAIMDSSKLTSAGLTMWKSKPASADRLRLSASP